MISFYKANSVGNIIGIFPEWDESRNLTGDLVRSFCGKHWGIDCDQLMVLGPEIAIWNRDGTKAEACGNGTRCVIATLDGTLDDRAVTLQGPVGSLKGWKQKDGRISVVQGPVKVGVINGFVDAPETIILSDIHVNGIPVHVGNPHIVVLETPPLDLDPMWQANHPFLPEGANVSFVSPRDGRFFVQTWERGVGRTLSCGSGACAVAATLYEKGLIKEQSVIVETAGGNIELYKTSEGWVHTAHATIVAKGYWIPPV